MEITDNEIVIFDIETFREIFLIGIYIPADDRYVEFEVSNYANQLYAFAKFFEQYKDHYWCGFNNIRFDAQVVEWIVRNYERWIDKSNLEICFLIYQKGQDTIDDANYEIFPEYKEQWLSFKQIDLFTIWHFNNENRRTSLKAIEFAIDFENIEESEVDFHKVGLTPEDIIATKGYCKNDVMATYALYKITRGDTDISIYKGEDKIDDRLAMMEEFDLPCLNWDNVKIGAEWNKADYIKLTHKNEKDLKPQKINYFYGKKFKQFFPRTVKFQTKELQQFVRDFGNTFALNKKQEFRYKFNDELTATIAKGGIHSNEKGRLIIPTKDEIYWQVDIGSQYPNAIRKYKVEPKHLPGWNSLIVSKIDRRLNYKRMYGETKVRKFNSLQKMGKDALNGGSYGQLNLKGSWQEDPCCMLQVTIGDQLEILMIVEDLILKGFRVLSLNTDGWDVIVPRDRDEEFHEILTNFEKIIGNDVLGQFEYTEFLWIAQTCVSSYIALKKDGTLKYKDEFEIDKELHKNKSARIIPIALREHFVNNIPVGDTIRQHNNIYDFCIRQKSSKFFHYEGINRKTGETNVYRKLIRYYVSNHGEKVFKIKNPECETNAAPVSQVEAGDWVMQVKNYLPKTIKVEESDINFDYYIMRAEKIIRKIQSGNKKETVKVIPGQLNLFD